MDHSDLDEWLDADDGVGTDGAARPSTRRATTVPRRPWRAIAVGGAVVWAAVVGVVLLGRGPDGAGDARAPVADVASGPADDPTLIDPLGSTAPDGVGASADAVVATDPAAPPATAGPVPVASAPGPGGHPPPVVHAGAVRALRSHLTTAGPPAGYLEWATPVVAAPLDAGAWLVEVEAIWLTGDGEQLDTVRTGRWAVPLADDGVALAPPWPLVTEAPRTSPVEPPTGSTRLVEVEQGLTAAGWEEVAAVAADPHPLLPDVLVALAEAIAPGDVAATSHLVWLVDGAAGLLVPMTAQHQVGQEVQR